MKQLRLFQDPWPKETLRKLTLLLSSKILANNWPEVKVQWQPNDEITVIQDKTPVQGFKRATIKVKNNPKIITIIEANPKKVIDAKHKVMVYVEDKETGHRRVGQVRWQNNKTKLIWF